MCTEKYMRKEKVRTLCWSTYGAQLLCVESFAILLLFVPLIPVVCFMCWLTGADSVHICLVEIWGKKFSSTLPKSVELAVLAVNLWTVQSCTFLVISSLTGMFTHICIAAFWTRLGAYGESATRIQLFSIVLFNLVLKVSFIFPIVSQFEQILFIFQE